MGKNNMRMHKRIQVALAVLAPVALSQDTSQCRSLITKEESFGNVIDRPLMKSLPVFNNLKQLKTGLGNRLGQPKPDCGKPKKPRKKMTKSAFGNKQMKLIATAESATVETASTEATTVTKADTADTTVATERGDKQRKEATSAPKTA